LGGTVIDFPDSVSVEIDNIPSVLKDIPKWVLWRWEQRGGKATKPPYTPEGRKASVNDPSTWTTFDEVVKALNSNSKKKFSGIGIILDGKDGIVGWDLDKVLNDKTLQLVDWASDLIKSLDSYTEITPSGTGLRSFVYGEIPEQGKRKSKFPSYDGNNEGVLEVYSGGRFLTITGLRWPESKHTIEKREASIYFRRFFDQDEPEIQHLKRNEKAQKLWNGEWKGDYGSQSEADLALCRYLADETDGDGERIDALFRKSNLFREKWDRVHHSDGSTYGQTTIQLALRSWSAAYHLTDLGNAKRFAKLIENEARYCYGKWYIWDSKRWNEDRLQRIVRSADRVIEQIYQEAKTIEDLDKAKDLRKHAKVLESRSRIEAMIKLTEAREPIPVMPDQLDSNHQAFACQNGVLDALQFREHRPNDLITKLSPVVYTPSVSSRRWIQFLNSIIPDQEIVDYLQRVVGYSMTGSVKEQKLFFCYGTGANGKSTFINTIMKLMGEYGRFISSEVLMAHRNEMHPTGIADLRGVRMAVASELEDGKRFNEQLIKAITGGEKITARRMREDFFEFTPTAKIWIVGNHKPTIRGTDHAIWRRIHLIPFTRTIPEEEQDKELGVKLENEIDAIFNWCVEGLKAWLSNGLMPPDKVLLATTEYKSEMDVIALFLEDECEVNPNFDETHASLYKRYCKVAEENREFVMNSRAFSIKLGEKGFEKFKGNGNVTKWKGLKVKIRSEEQSPF
jgi:putative DNA primase/helicase